MRRITQDFNTCGSTLISSNCVIYPNDDLTLSCDNLCFPSNLTDIIKCINDSISLDGLDLKCAEPECLSCFEFTIKNVFQLLIDKICEPLDCNIIKSCIDCQYIQDCVEFPVPEPRITCDEIRNTCVDCEYINSCVDPYVLDCTSVQNCVTEQFLETRLSQSFDFAIYNNVSGVFNLDCTAVQDCIDCEYIRSCVPAVTCEQILPCITCSFLQSKIDEIGCLTFPTQDVSFSSPYIYFKTIKDEFNETIIYDFEAIEQAPAANLCSGVTYELFNAKTNLSLISGTLAAIATYMNNNYATTVASGIVSNSGTMVTPGLYHLQIKSTCSGNTYIGNEIQFEIETVNSALVTQSFKNGSEFNDSTVSETWANSDSANENNHYYTLYYAGSTMLTPNNVEVNTYGFRATFNSATSPGPSVINSADLNKNPYIWISNFKGWLNTYGWSSVSNFRYKLRGTIFFETTSLNSTNNFSIRYKTDGYTPTKISASANYTAEINQNGYTQLNGTFNTDPGHNFDISQLKLTKPL